MKKILLSPYPGHVVVTNDRKEHARLYRRMFGQEYEGTMRRGLATHQPGTPVFLVYAANKVSLVHELTHVALDLFDIIQADPIEANGEPMAYLMGHLFEQATRR